MKPLPPKHDLRPLTPEEKRLWRWVTKNDIPLAPQEDQEEYSPPPQPYRSPKKSSVSRRIQQEAPVITTGKHAPLPLESGSYANIDRNTAERFRKGRYAIDASLDLHGMTRDKAYSALVRFITMQYQYGNRCLLVITGKGQRKERDEEGPRIGVLKELMPRWLAEDALKPMILAFDSAQAKHGGSGAFYILLRRKR